MIREIVTEAWQQDPRGVVLAVLLTPVVLYLLWVLLVVVIVAVPMS